MLEQALPSRQAGERNRRRMNVVKSGGLCCNGVLVHDGLLRIAAAVDIHHPQNLVADIEPRRWCAAFLDGSGNVRPERVG
jgi:hypothetical protein